jgi:hypothetical protein
MLSALLRRLVVVSLTVACMAVTGKRVHADAIVVTKAMTANTVAEIFIEEDEVRVEIETGVPDLVAFADIFPDEFRVRMGLESESDAAGRHRRFFNEGLVIRADGGRPLPGRVVSFETRRRLPRDEITGDPLPAGEGEGRPVVFVVLSYPLKDRPDTLGISPPVVDGTNAASIGFMTYHLGLPVMDFRYLGVEEIVDLDWNDPWYSKFRNRNLWRQYDAPINVFLYVEPFEVRVEVVLRPRDVQEWTDVGIGDLDTIPVAIQDDVKRAVAAYLAENLDLTVDGEPVAPQLDRVNFLNRTLRTSTVINPPRDLDASAATLGVIFVEPRSGYPQEAAVTWDLFPDRVDRIPAAATDEAGPLRFFLQREDNVLWWRNFLKSPSLPSLVDVRPPPTIANRLAMWLSWLVLGVSLALFLRAGVRAIGGAGSWSSAAIVAVVVALSVAGTWWSHQAVRTGTERAAEIVEALLHNVYRAFDYRDEEMIYGVLEASVTGSLLTEIYLETRRGLELESQGGARAKVRRIELVEIAGLESDDGIASRCTWNVEAAVGHWGHIHQRINQYVADVTIEVVDDRWKIVSLELVDERRL